MAPYRFTCSNCGERLSTAPSKAGHKVKCPACKHVVLVPITGDAVPQHAPTAPVSDAPSLRTLEPVPPPTTELEPVELSYADADSSRRTKRSADEGVVRVRRSVVYLQGFLLGAVALAFFVFGVVVGSRSARRDARMLSPRACNLTGAVTYTDSGDTRFPDEGCVVCVVPAARRPDQKLPAEALGPDAPKLGPENAVRRNIQQLGGDYCRADARGEYRLHLPTSGRYYLLVVSSHAIRPPTRQPIPRDLAEMGRYFVPATTLVGQYQYRWQSIQLTSDRTLDVEF